MSVLIEADKPLSQSMLWEIQRSYFLKAGMQAWQDDVVPHQISCNPFMARAYAQLIHGYLTDCADHIDPAEPIYLIELGAGSGRLTHHLIYQLLPMVESGPLAHLKLKFVLTDFAQKTVDYWLTHPKLKSLAENGLLDFALFDVADIRPLRLTHSELDLSAENLRNPAILLANYFFDSIPQDSFAIEDGELHANLLSLYSTQQEPDLSDPTLWERLTLAYEAIPSSPEPYKNELYSDILADYEAQLPDTTLTFPNSGLDCIRFWEQFGDMLLLTADRGYAHAESLIGQDDPLPNLHGSFSMMVNYHAITEYIERAGGTAFYPEHYQDNVQTLAYVLGGKSGGRVATQQAFDQVILQNGPDDYFALRQILRPQFNSIDLSQLLSLLRWSVFDGDILAECFEQLEMTLHQEGEAWHADVVEALERVKVQYLPIRPDDDLIGQIDRLIEKMMH